MEDKQISNKIIEDSKSGHGQRPQFGNRMLVDSSKVFEHNAWDNVEWDDEQEADALKTVTENASNPLSNELQEKYECEADQYWNAFYMQHQNRFFKDRHWLFTEFPELSPDSICDVKYCENNCDNHGVEERTTGQTPRLCSATETESYPGCNAERMILEVGCGVGNTVFPILETNNDPGLFVYCCDFSSVAIDLVQAHPEYQNGRCHGFVCDITQDNTFPFPFECLDVIILIFVLSAVHPEKFKDTIKRLVQYLKPGGRILFRDYGRYDLAQLRFKKGKCLGENFYVRGDGTRCYFFTEEEVKALFEGEGLIEEQIYVDRRLQVNRGRQLKMYRIWIQGKYKKPLMSDKNISVTEDEALNSPFLN